MRMYKKKPCRGCAARCYQDMDCPVWQEWFLESWEAVNRAGWQVCQDAFQRQQSRDVFRYALPHEEAAYLRRSPCKGCVCEPWCDRVCGRYAQWWDARMAKVRGKIES